MNTVEDPTPQPRPSWPRIAGPAAGVAAAAAALGTGQLVAALTGPAGSPVHAVGAAAVDLTPGLLTLIAAGAQAPAAGAVGTAVQPEQRAVPFPAGATGWHSTVVTVT
ncbi:hypothetical protein [Streptomyces sp. TLI_171]|uniref:hypothetical protein n=1 Tax=Streptomyces sp. TLI_171 TaxID=1938859 RepID=UPI00117F2355|nr:hypothetical protein [Streptomyces sp. TLI_171]